MNCNVKAILLVPMLALVLAGCGSEEYHDAPKANRDTGPADLINFPDGFRNVAHKCDGPNMVYVTSHGEDTTLISSITVVANDPRCGAH